MRQEVDERMESWRSVKTRQNVCKCEAGITVKSYSAYETAARPAMMHGFEMVALTTTRMDKIRNVFLSLSSLNCCCSRS